MAKKTKTTNRAKSAPKAAPAEPQWEDARFRINSTVFISGVRVRVYEHDGRFWVEGGGMETRELRSTDLAAAKSEGLTLVEFHLRSLAEDLKSFRENQ